MQVLVGRRGELKNWNRWGNVYRNYLEFVGKGPERRDQGMRRWSPNLALDSSDNGRVNEMRKKKRLK
jgi:hypothetical protein